MSEGCYDTNPPLSILLYVPYIWISNITSIEAYNVLFWLTLAPIIFATIAVKKILACFIEKQHSHILSISFLCSVTIVPSLYFVERDHFIAMFIFPLICVQYCITQKIKVPAIWKYSILILAAITLLLKPHQGLIPLFMLLHRMYVQKKLWIIQDIDFIILAATSILYVLVVFIFYNDFVTEMLPYIVDFYLPYINFVDVFKKLEVFFPLWMIATALALITYPNEKFLKILCVTSGICLFVFTLLAKGFFYQLLPFITIFWILGTYLTTITLKTNNILIVILIFGLSYLFAPLRPHFPTHEEYKNNVITKYIKQNCAEPCSFLFLHTNMDIVNQISFYNKDTHVNASRFPAFWFQPALEGFVSVDKDINLADAKAHFSSLIAQDIKKMNPSLLVIPNSKHEDPNFITFYSTSPEFRKAIAPYKKIDTLTVDRTIFGYDEPYELTWDIYKK